MQNSQLATLSLLYLIFARKNWTTCTFSVYSTVLFSILQIYKDSQFNNRKIKNSKIQSGNKTQTLRKFYTFLNKVCTRRGHINININNNDNNKIDNSNNNNNNNNKMCIYIYIKIIEREKREREKIIDIYLRHKGIQWKTEDCLIQRKCFQN